MKRPDTYVGSVERTADKMWVYNSANESMEFREVTYVPGLYKIFDEILVNAADNKQNDKNMSEIRVTVDRETGEVSIKNDGKGIPVEIHQVCCYHGSYRTALMLSATRHLCPRNDLRSSSHVLEL